MLLSGGPLTLQFKNWLVLSDAGALKCSWKCQEMFQVRLHKILQLCDSNIYSFYVFRCNFFCISHLQQEWFFFFKHTACTELVGKAQGLLYLCRTPHFLSLPSFKWNTNLIWKDHTRPHVVYFGQIIHMLQAAKRGRESFPLSSKSTVPSKQWLSLLEQNFFVSAHWDLKDCIWKVHPLWGFFIICEYTTLSRVGIFLLLDFFSLV